MSTVVPRTPRLHNTWQQDRALRRHLALRLPSDLLAQQTGSFDELGHLAANELFDLAREAELNPPTLRQYDIYGGRIDRIETSHAWKRISEIGVRTGIVQSGHDASLGEHARLVQMTRLMLFAASSAYVMCPMAMTDGAATVLSRFPSHPRFAEAVARLTSTDPAVAWSSGQWMTEIEGGSDVSRTATTARLEDGVWRVYGTKFFTSATTANCTLLLARPEGAGPGSRGLSLFYLEPWNLDGSANALQVRRLKEKLGTRAMPTAELELMGTTALPVGELGEGVRRIAGVLNVARYYNTVGAVAYMGRGIQLAREFARLRVAFGSPLEELPLHVETLAAMQVNYEAALSVCVRLAQLLGRVEHGTATDHERAVWRILTPLAKLGTGRDTVAQASETLEAFGGSGYMEDSGLPTLLRDAQVLPIWEGTTNVLSLDIFRAATRDGALEALLVELEQGSAQAEKVVGSAVAPVRQAVHACRGMAAELMGASPEAMQTCARALALNLYRTTAALLLWQHALDVQHTPSAAAARTSAERWSERRLIEPLPLSSARYAESRALVFVD